MVRHDGHAQRGAPRGHATQQDRALRPAPWHRPTGRFHELCARCPDLGAGVYARCQRLEPLLVHPAREPPAPCMARAGGLERTGATRRGRIVTPGAPPLAGGEPTAEHRTGWTARRVRGRLIGDLVLAASPPLRMGRGERGRARSGVRPPGRHGCTACPWSSPPSAPASTGPPRPAVASTAQGLRQARSVGSCVTSPATSRWCVASTAVWT